MVDYKGIGRRIAHYRKKIKMTQAVLSEKLDITESYVCQVERGTTKISLTRLYEIAEILGVDVAFLVSDSIVYNGVAINNEIFEITKSWDKQKTDFLINMLVCANNQFNDKKTGDSN